MFPCGGEKPFGLGFCPPKDELCGPDPSLSDELTSILNELTQLSKSEHCKVALRARQVGLRGAIVPAVHSPSAALPRLTCTAWPRLLPCEVGSPPPLHLLPVQVLIASHLPSYELRHNQVESIFLSAIDMYGHQFCPENLKVRLSPVLSSTFHSVHCGPRGASGKWLPLPYMCWPSDGQGCPRGPQGSFGRSSTLQDGQQQVARLIQECDLNNSDVMEHV